MDVSAEIDHFVKEMEWKDVVSTLQAALQEVLADTPNPPPPPPVPAGLELNTHPQSVNRLGGGYSGCIPMRAALHVFEHQSLLMSTPTMYPCGPVFQENTMQPAHLYSQAGVYSQGQYLPNRWPVIDVRVATAVVGHPAAPPHTYNDAPAMRLPGGLDQNLRCVGMLNGDLLYELPAQGFVPPVSAAPPPNTFKPKRRRKRPTPQEDDRPYVKKPPNAFMLFMKEQRPNVEAEICSRGSAAVNTVLGRRWKSLTKEDQAKYYEQAEKERLLHAQRHPKWCGSDNYGKKKFRLKRKAPTTANVFSSRPKEDTQTGVMEAPHTQTGVMEAPRTQTGVMEAPHTQTGVMEAPCTQTGVMEAPHTQAVVTVPVCDMCRLPQVDEFSPASLLEAPITASTSLASPSALVQTPAGATDRCHPVTQQLEPCPDTVQQQWPSPPHNNIFTVDN
uniref:HMG box domain-containing protein n=1 Tax=Dicentrarchus labrax TaxID=13489 RepID=A0A8C4I3S2_DICLA